MAATATKPRTRRPKAEPSPATPPAATVEAPEAPTPPEPPAPPPVETPEPPASDASEDGSEGTAIAERPRRRALTIPGVKAEFTATALILPEEYNERDWLRVVNSIDMVREGARWWWGDAINAGEARFNEKYSQALDMTQYDYATLRNLTMVARRYAPERRHAALTWSHHHAVIGVPDDVADDLLAWAEGENPPKTRRSVADLRTRVKEIKAEAAPGSEPVRGQGPTVPGSPVATPDQPGEKPLTAEQIEEYRQAGKIVYDCGGCGLTFGVSVWQCLGCGSHWAADVDDCQNERCGEVVNTPAPTPTGSAPSPADVGPIRQGQPAPAATNGTTPAVSGAVIAPTPRNADEMISSLISYPFDALDPSDIALDLARQAEAEAISDPIAALMGLHHWLGQVLEALAGTDDDGRDGPQAPPDDEDASDIGELDFGDVDDADDVSGPSVDVTPPPAPAPAVAATNGATDKPLASEPSRPAPKPGAARKRKAQAPA